MTLRRTLTDYGITWESKTFRATTRAFAVGVLIGVAILGVVVVAASISPAFRRLISPQRAEFSQAWPNASEPVAAPSRVEMNKDLERRFPPALRSQ
jgi:hypothetical protein